MINSACILVGSNALVRNCIIKLGVLPIKSNLIMNVVCLTVAASVILKTHYPNAKITISSKDLEITASMVKPT